MTHNYNNLVIAQVHRVFVFFVATAHKIRYKKASSYVNISCDLILQQTPTAILFTYSRKTSQTISGLTWYT